MESLIESTFANVLAVLVNELDFEHASHIGVHPHQPVGFSLGFRYPYYLLSSVYLHISL
jgi:hypothetical protein